MLRAHGVWWCGLCNVSMRHEGETERDMRSLHEARGEVCEVTHGGGGWEGREERLREGGVAGRRRDRGGGSLDGGGGGRETHSWCDWVQVCRLFLAVYLHIPHLCQVLLAGGVRGRCLLGPFQFLLAGTELLPAAGQLGRQLLVSLQRTRTEEENRNRRMGI